jgi:hypothetical protein
MDLDDWVQSVHPWLGGLEASLAVDFSRESLVALERLAAAAESDAYAAYLGETLLRVGGGRWAEVDGRPGVTADPALGLAPVVPADLLEAAGAATRTYDEWAVAARAAAEPGWRPVMEPTPGFGAAAVAETPELERWFAERAADFPAWVARWAPDGTWDFSAASLDRLAELLNRLLESRKAVDDPANCDLVDGALWYLGDTCRRAGDGQWSWSDGPYLINLGPGHAQMRLRVQLKTGMGTPGYLSEKCESLKRGLELF